MGLVGWTMPGSPSLTSTWAMTVAAVRWMRSRRNNSNRIRWIMYPMPPCESETQVSRGRRGTRRSPSSERMRILPICGPLPWVMTIFAPLRKSGMRWPRVSAVCSNCWGMVPGSPGRVMALPPRAMTRVSLMEGQPSLTWRRGDQTGRGVQGRERARGGMGWETVGVILTRSRGDTEEDAERQKETENLARRQRRFRCPAARRARESKTGENTMTENHRVRTGFRREHRGKRRVLFHGVARGGRGWETRGGDFESEAESKR